MELVVVLHFSRCLGPGFLTGFSSDGEAVNWGMQRVWNLFWVVALLALFSAGLLLGVVGAHWLRRPAGLQVIGTATIVQRVQTLADLVTVKYVLEKVVILEAPPQSTLGEYIQGDNRVMLLAHGIVKAGVNLQDITAADVQVSGKNIRVKLPMAHITDCYLDEQKTQVIDWKLGFLRAFDKDLEQTARRQAVEDIRSGALASGILHDASERAQWQLAAFLHEAGYDQVEFVGDGLGKPVVVPKDGGPQF